MKRSTGIALAGAVAVVVVGAGAGIAIAGAGGDDDTPLTGDTYDRAGEAALESVDGGEVTETEVGDGGAAYEVEIRLEDGSQVEVQLDEDFAVIGAEPDDHGPGDEDGDDDGDDD